MANVTGTPSNDSLVGTNKRDSLIGFAGNDTLQGLGGNDILDGGAGDDQLVGGSGSDTYYFASGYGHDVIDNSGSANDTDTIQLQGLNIADIRLTREGNDLVLTIISTGETLRVTQHFLDVDHAIDQISFANNIRWNSSDILANLYSPPAGPTEGSDTLQGTASNDSLQGLGGDDILIGMAGNDTLEGGSGADHLEGGTGKDTLDGGSGADYMDGGADDDIYVVDDAGDLVIEGAKAGTDTVRASISYTLTDNVEQLILTGADNLSATGNARQNTLIGNDGNNLLDGGAGTDSMTGGKGDDTYVVDRVGETVTEAVNEGNDTVRSAINYTLGNNLENLELTGTGNLSGTGNSLNNRLIGNGGNNQLAGGGGDD